jgi:protein tyrosine phosphatase (PTP) superfamily phosphohydrolase (DUF442 family)
MSLETIYNFIQINPQLATSGQPTEIEFTEIAGNGYQEVINLALKTSSGALPDEAGTVKALGMSYHPIPVVFDAPKMTDFEQFCSTMDSLNGKKVFVHCQANWRVSMFVALYAEKRWGWSREKADEHMLQMWELDEVWEKFIEEVRNSQ